MRTPKPMMPDAPAQSQASPQTLPRALRQQAENARERGRWSDAVAAAGEAVRLDPNAADGWAELSLALLAVRRDGESLDAAYRAVQCDVAWPPARRVLALALLRHRRVADAEDAVTVALRDLPHYPEGLATLALIRMTQGRDQDADALFLHARAIKGGMAEATGNHAALLARMGRDREALIAAEQAIALKPFLSAPHTLRGGLLHRTGRFADAADAFAAALAADPGASAELHANHSDSLRLAQRGDDAVKAARRGLVNHPAHPALLANLGAALQAVGRPDDALAAHERALRAAPDLAEVENNIAVLHLEAGRPDRALDHLRRAFAARPTASNIARNLAALLLDVGQPEEAERAAQAAADAEPRSPAALILVGRARVLASRLEEAGAAFNAALRLDPSRVETWLQTGVSLLQAGRRVEASAAFRQLCRLAPGNARHWALLGQSLRRVRFATADDELRADLLAALAQPGTESAHLTDAATSVLLLTPALTRLRDATDDAARAMLASGLLRDLAADPLPRALLRSCVVTDPALEKALTTLRRAFLADADADNPAALADPAWLPFLCALADQGFLNEHVFAESPEEGRAVAILAARLETMLAADVAPDPARVALLAAYRPLRRWTVGLDLLRLSWPASVARLLTRQVEEPLAEETLKAELPRLTTVDDPVSTAVRAQYEENPYPRWTQVGLLDAPIPLPVMMRTLFPHLHVAPDASWSEPEVLVAGCGSGREAAWAANHIRGARVLAVDLSLSSLAHAARQGAQLGLNVAWAQADILKLGEALAERRFDVIQSVGVLHHMADPLLGWTALRGLLRPRGLMKIGLYSARARRPLQAAQDFAAAGGYAPSTDGIRRFRQDVLALPDDHPAKAIIASPDFHSASACRDLVFHVHEHQLSLPRIADWLDQLELDFLGFQLEDPAIATLYRTRFPQDPMMTSLALWDRFEGEFPHSFGELYQFWVRPKA